LIHELTDESSLHITNAEWFTPSGAALTGVGLTPDTVVEEGDDPVVDALEIVRTFEVAKN
jgi:C-terminal processing protease CtpA/Prc